MARIATSETDVVLASTTMTQLTEVQVWSAEKFGRSPAVRTSPQPAPPGREVDLGRLRLVCLRNPVGSEPSPATRAISTQLKLKA